MAIALRQRQQQHTSGSSSTATVKADQHLKRLTHGHGRATVCITDCPHCRQLPAYGYGVTSKLSGVHVVPYSQLASSHMLSNCLLMRLVYAVQEALLLLLPLLLLLLLLPLA